jgi:hypothetical protein
MKMMAHTKWRVITIGIGGVVVLVAVIAGATWILRQRSIGRTIENYARDRIGYTALTAWATKVLSEQSPDRRKVEPPLFLDGLGKCVGGEVDVRIIESGQTKTRYLMVVITTSLSQRHALLIGDNAAILEDYPYEQMPVDESPDTKPLAEGVWLLYLGAR